MSFAHERFRRLFRRFLTAVLLSLIGLQAGEAVAAPKASLVMDLRNGKVLQSRSADRKLHPASLTKMMTLYVTFKAIRDGRLRLDQKVRVSRHAARQPASKLYLKSGRRVTVRSLIRATAIKSANDAAMVLAEAVGGSQSGFARMMTREAKRLGMKNSVFKNPHGLTQRGHYSTARDMALLGRHLFFDFPQYYNIFKRRTDYAAGKRIWNTNRLLSTYSGADGIKTGYTRAAGYNLVATAHRGKKRVLAVQFGASSSGDRARRVARLLDIGFSRAKNNVKKIKPRKAAPAKSGGKRKSGLVAAAPLPRVRPGSKRVTGLAVVTEALSPRTAQAALPTGRLSRTARAPMRAELPRSKPGSKIVATAKLVDTPKPRRLEAAGLSVPLPKPRPLRLAKDGQLSWAAELGPYQTESDALVQLAELGLVGVDTDAEINRSVFGRNTASYVIRLPQSSEVDAVVVCSSFGQLSRPCRVSAYEPSSQ
ncbi:MAG: serine hydrolase [Paracoccaceae bacterium]